MRPYAIVFAFVAAGCNVGVTVSSEALTLTTPSWPQWSQNPQHTNFLPVAGQSLGQNLIDLVYDPLVPAEMVNNTDPASYNGSVCSTSADCGANQFCVQNTCLNGDLLAHFQTPLVDGSDVYMEAKGGVYSVNTYASQEWCEDKYTWVGNQLVLQWDFMSDWKAPGGDYDFWEPVFHAALANGYIYVPGASGTIVKLNKSDGTVVARLDPFQLPDGPNPNTYTVSPITADAAGNLYYNVLQLDGQSHSITVSSDESLAAPRNNKGPRASNFYGQNAVDSWLVKVTPSGKITKASYGTLVPGAPGKNDQCLTAFNDNYPGSGGDPLPWPPSPTAVPSTTKCGLMRVAINIAPAIDPRDGTIYSVTRAHLVSRYAYLVAINSNLTSKWAASLRDRFHDGCGVPFSQGGTLPPNGAPGGCRVGANYGVDPATNRPGGGRVLDDSSSTPLVAPDGSVFYGAYSRYNWAQGHLMHFSSSGAYLGAYLFGWDVTPGLFAQGSSYSIVIKENHYGSDPGACAWNSNACFGSYCYDPAFCPSDRSAQTLPGDPERYFITQLDPSLNVQWQYRATNTDSCSRHADGSVSCVSNHPNAFEWCVNAPVIDANGVVYANSEDGWLYAINQGGTLKQRIFQQLALGAAYTPTSLGADGRIYSQNAGHLFVVGN
jgi:hypothetical protein